MKKKMYQNPLGDIEKNEEEGERRYFFRDLDRKKKTILCIFFKLRRFLTLFYLSNLTFSVVLSHRSGAEASIFDNVEEQGFG